MVVRTCEEDLAMETAVEALNTIGAAVGIPATLLIGWIFVQVRANTKRIEELEKARETDRKEADSKLSEIYTKLNTLVADVSFIRGRLERE